MSFFTLEKLEKHNREIRTAIYRGAREIPSFKFMQGDCPGAQAMDFDDGTWEDFRVGDFWGGYDITAWFRAWVSVPLDWHGKRLHLQFLVGPRDGGDSTAETLLHVNGEPLQAIDVWHEEAWLPPEMIQHGKILIALKAWSGVLGVPDRRHFKLARLVWIDDAAFRLYYRADALLRTVCVLDENDLRRSVILQAVNQAFQQVDFGTPRSEAFYQSVADAADQLDTKLIEWQQIEEHKPTVTGIGHAHIDMAWLWRLRHTREKAARTFSTALHLMRQYPDYRFVHSSPQLYKFLKEDHPEIFARVKERIATGEWEITGGTWVEPDTNLPNGESLVRQFLYGMCYAREEFGVRMNLLWLPDVFGYSYSLPQIIKKCGIDRFMTTKISWSQFNRFPYDTFRWRGIDGSEVLTHFVTTPEKDSWFYTYNGQLRPEDVKGIWDAYRQKPVNDELLLVFGWGDGGGGPTQEMLEWAQAQKNLPGLPYVQLGKTEPYFDRLEQAVADQDLPVWDGELYLEFHRGTYTSQAFIKRANRKSEILFHTAEWLSALADLLTGQDLYPSRELRDGWESLLLNQFHDILPGSSIRQVYEDAARDYERVTDIGLRTVSQAQERLLADLSLPQESIVVFNPLSWSRDELVRLPWSEQLTDNTVKNLDGTNATSQVVVENGEKFLLLDVQGVPPLGYQAYSLVSADPPRSQSVDSLTISPTLLESDFYRIEITAQGQISSLYDKLNARHVLAPGMMGNVLLVFEDKPMAFDAWDIDIYYQEKMRQVVDFAEARVLENGPLRGILYLAWRFGNSAIRQYLTIYARSPRLDFRTEVDWHEQQVLLKVAFPVNIRASRATYDIQFGNIERPTHWNTSWDWARFEVCGQKWADLSEGNYGVALLNDCKYGYDIRDNVMRLTLIKSAIHPDPQADQGRHEFIYSLLPHNGGWREADVVHQGYALNVPLTACYASAREAGSVPSRSSFASLSVEHVILETVKKAEDGDAWIIRLYEYKQRHNRSVHLDFNFAIRKAVECNLIEENEIEAIFQNKRLTFSIKPYEIKTFKIYF